MLPRLELLLLDGIYAFSNKKFAYDVGRIYNSILWLLVSSIGQDHVGRPTDGSSWIRSTLTWHRCSSSVDDLQYGRRRYSRDGLPCRSYSSHSRLASRYNWLLAYDRTWWQQLTFGMALWWYYCPYNVSMSMYFILRRDVSLLCFLLLSLLTVLTVLYLLVWQVFHRQ